MSSPTKRLPVVMASEAPSNSAANSFHSPTVIASTRPTIKVVMKAYEMCSFEQEQLFRLGSAVFGYATRIPIDGIRPRRSWLIIVVCISAKSIDLKLDTHQNLDNINSLSSSVIQNVCGHLVMPPVIARLWHSDSSVTPSSPTPIGQERWANNGWIYC